MMIRQATFADAEVLASLCITVWIDTYCIDGIEPSHSRYVLNEYSPEKVKQRIQNRSVFIAERNHITQGVMVFDIDTGEVETLYILPKFQGNGIGRLLLDKVKDSFSGEMFLTCWERNEVAIKFYKNYGFIESGEHFFHLDGENHRNLRLTFGYARVSLGHPLPLMEMIHTYKSEFKERCYEIFNALDGWFGSEEINADYTNQLNQNDSFVAIVNGKVEGVISLVWHFGTTAEVYSMAVSPSFHRQGVGKQLIAMAEELAKQKGYEFLHVKTLGDEVPHEGYEKTRRFYEANGFKRLFQTKDLWDGLPTMLYVKKISC